MTTSSISVKDSSTNFFRKLWGWIRKVPPVYPIFLVIFITLGFLNPRGYQTMNGIMTYLRPSSPLAVLAIGQMVVLALGGFDLSVGAMVTSVVLVSSKFLANDPDNALPNILMLIGFGVLVGLINGLVVSFLKLPSFITTLGMMMVVRGARSSGTPEGVRTKEGIHPKYFDVEARCACGATWNTRSTKQELHLEICSSCHPFYTGRQKIMDTEGRVERFTKKFGAQTSESRKQAAAKAKKPSSASA